MSEPNLSIYSVKLNKDDYGLGIYFSDINNQAYVDYKVPFYRLPNGEQGPGEASGTIQPGDHLIQINKINVFHKIFPEIIKILRSLQNGIIELTFLSYSTSNNLERTNIKSNSSMEISQMINKTKKEFNSIVDTTDSKSIKRDKNCYLLALQKMETYRLEVLRLTHENQTIRNQLTKESKEKKDYEEFYNEHALFLI